MSDTGDVQRPRGWQVWAGVLAVVAVVVASAAWAASRPQKALVLSSGGRVTSVGATSSPSPKPVPPSPTATGGTPCPSSSPALGASTAATPCGGWWHSLATANASCAPATQAARASV